VLPPSALDGEVGLGVPAPDVAASDACALGFLRKDDPGAVPLIHRIRIRHPISMGRRRSDFEFHRTLLNQQRVTESARPASLVSLYLLFMSLAV
jgi:hypothetical protein